MDSTINSDTPSPRPDATAQGNDKRSGVVALLNRNLGLRPHRSRRGFASGKARLFLKIDADCATTGDGLPLTGQSTPASSSSCCSSDVVPWWEVEYQCPPPGHLGAHVVPVSAEIQVEAVSGPVDGTTTSIKSDVHASNEHKINAIRTGLVLTETPERARRGTHSKLTAIRASVPCRTCFNDWTELQQCYCKTN